MRVVLAGAGIGGLTAALALGSDIEVVVLEQTQALTEIGAGLQLSPNATRILQRLGLGDALKTIGFEPEANEVREAASGALMLRQPLGAAARKRWDAPYLAAHRGDLQKILRQAVADRPNVELRLGVRVEGFDQDGPGVHVRVAGGESLRADALVGCDGLRSSVRQALWGADQPRFTGMMAWRGTVEADRLPAGLIPPVNLIWTGKGRHFVHYYVRGGALVNFVGIVRRPDWRSESWTEQGDKADLASDFRGWPPSAQALIEAVPAAFRWALFDREPLAAWSKGRVSLLGDAAHPMLPTFAQGASQSIEDAEALGAWLRDPATVSASLTAYEAERRGRTTRLQLLSRRNAWLFHLGAPARGLFMAEAALARVGLTKGPARFDWLYGYDRRRARVSPSSAHGELPTSFGL
ncbi:MAG TPA: FAD-dependent monooxygenase [Caulobacteraceae bacterium]|jgi:salicylate hydroxylase|nr:FAD-dependent monooxygenase [Caulobacteraceae bacterium]